MVLGESLRLPCGVLLPNRLAKAAIEERLADRSHAPTLELGVLYQRWADGGAGLAITGSVMIDRRAVVDAADVVLEDERDLELHRAIAALGTVNGAHLWMQLDHPGRQTFRNLSKEPVAPSAAPGLASLAHLFAPARALTGEEIEALVARFARSAAIAKKAGYTGVQILAAHGHLVSQFLSPKTNRRDDAWGGTPEKRRRFLVEIVRAVRREVGEAFPISVKLSSTELVRGALEAETPVGLARALEKERIDLLELSGGPSEPPAMYEEIDDEPTLLFEGEEHFLDHARRVRREVRTPLMLTGGFRTATAMIAALEEGVVDLIGLGRPLALEPDLPARLLSGGADRSQVVVHHLGHKQLDALAERSWYTHQLHRMSRGLDPDPRFALWRALATSGIEAVSGLI